MLKYIYKYSMEQPFEEPWSLSNEGFFIRFEEKNLNLNRESTILKSDNVKFQRDKL